jgi:hypothetical protein
MGLTPVLAPEDPRKAQNMLQSIGHNTATDKPAKPREGFPLFPHTTGRWAKKVRGRFHYFGKIANDPKGTAALELWLQQRDDLLAGRTPRAAGDGLTIRELVNRFLSVKQHQVQTREITRRYFDALFTACELLVRHFGKMRLVEDLAAIEQPELIAKTSVFKQCCHCPIPSLSHLCRIEF